MQLKPTVSAATDAAEVFMAGALAAQAAAEGAQLAVRALYMLLDSVPGSCGDACTLALYMYAWFQHGNRKAQCWMVLTSLCPAAAAAAALKQPRRRQQIYLYGGCRMIESSCGHHLLQFTTADHHQ
jgi:hypothetical protein